MTLKSGSVLARAAASTLPHISSVLISSFCGMPGRNGHLDGSASSSRWMPAAPVSSKSRTVSITLIALP